MSEFSELLQLNNIDDYYGILQKRLVGAGAIYLFGAGFNCYRAMDWIKTKDSVILDKIKCVFDNNNAKWGSYIDKYQIEPPKLIGSDKYAVGNSDIFLITCGSGAQIIEQLISYGVSRGNIEIFTISHSESFEQFPSFLKNHMEEFESVYEMLEDQKSKSVFIGLINFRLSADFKLLETIADEYHDQYFDTEILNFDKDSVYLDCGAYIGDTIDEYVSHNGLNYKSIISIEADPGNYELLCNNARKYPNITCLNFGVWSSDGIIKFKSMQSGASNYISEDGDVIVQAKKIDEIMKSSTVTHIKMDIEGAEVPALVGSYETIAKNKPSLAICIYHKVDDFITIPLLIKAMNPNYRIYIRQYQKMSALETVCYAVDRGD